MNLAATKQEFEQIHRKQWKFQQTFFTPLNDLPTFVSTIFSAFEVDHATVTIDHAVFEPKTLLRLLACHSIAANSCENISVAAVGRAEIAALLVAALSDWLDFLFMPISQQFAIYADHDEYATFFCDSHSELDRLTIALRRNGFNAVPDFTRNL